MGAYLMTPGPTRVPERVALAGALPMMHHRTREFSEILRETIDKVRTLFGTSGDVLMIACSGRGAMEASVVNLFSPGDQVLSVNNGHFGEMFAGIAEAFGLKVHRVCIDWGKPADASEIEDALKANSQIRAVLVAHCESSTGMANDVESIAKVTRRLERLCVVDAVSSLGCMPLKMDEWGIDVIATASQKGLMSPAGLAFVAVGPRAWEAIAGSKGMRSYFDFPKMRSMIRRELPETPYSTPVSIVRCVHEALRMIHEEGVDRVYERHAKVSATLRAGLAELGLKAYVADGPAAAKSVTTVFSPEGMEPKSIIERVEKRYGILLGGGIGRLGEATFRVGHMGAVSEADVLRTLAALKAVISSR